MLLETLLITACVLLLLILILPWTRKPFLHVIGHYLQHAIEHLALGHPRVTLVAVLTLGWSLTIFLVGGFVLLVAYSVHSILSLLV